MFGQSSFDVYETTGVMQMTFDGGDGISIMATEKLRFMQIATLRFSFKLEEA